MITHRHMKMVPTAIATHHHQSSINFKRQFIDARDVLGLNWLYSLDVCLFAALDMLGIHYQSSCVRSSNYIDPASVFSGYMQQSMQEPFAVLTMAFVVCRRYLVILVIC